MTPYAKTFKRFQRIFGEPLGVGRLRAAFRDGDTVLKVPLSEVGEHGNYEEADSCNHPYEPRAEAWIDEIWTKREGIVILRMEYVRHRGSSKHPDWTWGVDGGQVGWTKAGRLVAYDWERAR